MPTYNVNDEMRQSAEYAIRMAKERFGEDLEYSESSLSKLEILIEQAYQQFSSRKLEGKVSNDTVVNHTAIVWGSYLGEIIRGKWGGTWIIGKESNRLIVINNIYFSPIYYVYQRITDQLQDNVEQYFYKIVEKLSSQPIKGFSMEVKMKKCPYCAEEIQDDAILCRFCGKDLSKKISDKKEKKTNRLGLTQGETKLLIGGVLFVIVACIVGLIIFNTGGGSAEFKSNLNVFLAEGEKLNVMTAQGVINSDYRNQLAQVKSAYSMLGDSWPVSLRNDKVLFDKAITIWDLTLQVWDQNIKSYNTLVGDPNDLWGKCELYIGTNFSNLSDCVNSLMALANNYFEEGRANINR